MAHSLNTKQKETVSRFISNTHTLYPVNSIRTRYSKNRSLILDFVNSYVSSVTMVQTGSRAEGIIMETSDSDIMFIVNGLKVLTTKKDEVDCDDIVLGLDRKKTRPGYARLQLLNTLKNEPVRIGPVTFVEDAKHKVKATFFVKEEDGTFLSSEKFASFFIGKIYQDRFFPSSNGRQDVFRNGPCTTSETLDDMGTASGRPGVKNSVDLAHAVECDDWPADIKRAWLSRSRKHSWLSEELVKRVAETRFLLVPVCQKGSNINYEWRLSFVLAEQKLVWSLNDTQIRVLLLLKKMLKRELYPVAQDNLSSYIMKTVLFWVSAETKLSLWAPQNLLNCLEKCLDYLLEVVKTKHLSHFINQEANLLENKLGSTSECVVSTIQNIRGGVLHFVFNTLDTESLLSDIWDKTHDVEVLLELMSACRQLNVHESEYAPYKTSEIYSNLITVFERIMGLPPNLRCEELADIAWWVRSIPETDKEFSEEVKDFFFLKLGVSLIHVRPGFAVDYFKNIEMVTKVPFVSVNAQARTTYILRLLYLGTAYFTQKNFSELLKVLQEIFKMGSGVAYAKRFDLSEVLEFSNEGQLTSRETGLDFTNLALLPACFDVVFSKYDIEIVPEPLKFECATVEMYGKNKLVSLNPVVYANLLLCLGHKELGHTKAFNKYLAILHKNVDLFSKPTPVLENLNIPVFQRFRMWNLLAYCYGLDGDFTSALLYYGKSITETDKFSVTATQNMGEKTTIKNSAHFQVAVLLYDLFRARKGE